jgi:NADH-quinone oxidoreductase subunit A
MNNALLFPPLAFVIFLFLSFGVSSFSRLFSAKGKDSVGKLSAYACGQETLVNRIKPNYNEFFPFAFFFTIMHVVTLLITTMPKEALWVAVLYLAIAVLSLRILFRR